MFEVIEDALVYSPSRDRISTHLNNAHYAVSITDVHIDGIDRRFEMRRRERDPWSEKYVLETF